MFLVTEKLKEINKATGLRIKSHKVITKGSESFIIEINDQWIFRFPRSGVLEEKMRKRWSFLAGFSKVSPIPVPAPEYIGNDWIGYKKLKGTPLYPTNIRLLDVKNRLQLATQLGAFLRVLHDHKDGSISFDTGYLIMRKEDYLSVPIEIAKRLSRREGMVLGRWLQKIVNNSANFTKPSTVIHGDLHFNNILWDKQKKIITGILDWSDLGLGSPAMDFIETVNFTKSTNNRFLKNMLAAYGSADEGLFQQIKEDSIIDVMNWFWSYFKADNKKGMARVVRKLKNLLGND